MYVPSMFKLEDPEAIREIIEGHSFGLFVTAKDGLPTATHLPFVYEPNYGANGMLLGHFARANPHWRDLGQELDEREALVIFQGPHAYVSPLDYNSEKPNVPTWNYLAVHAYGTPKIIDDPTRTKEVLTKLTDKNESLHEVPWTVSSLGEDYVANMMKGIVAFEMPISRLEAKAKLNQNKPRAQIEAAAEALAKRENPLAKETAGAMREAMKGE